MRFDACMRPAGKLVAGVMMVMGLGLVGCGDESVPAQTAACSYDTDCQVGQVCLLAQKQCGAVPCVGADGVSNCLDGQICLALPSGESVCSRPQCTTSAECTAPSVCSGGKCVMESCSTKDDCSAGKICNLAGACVDPPPTCGTDSECPAGQVCLDDGQCGEGCGSDTDCPAGRYCDTGARLCATGCRDSTECDEGQVCGANRSCACTTGSCPAGKACDSQTGLCIVQDITSCDQVTCQPGTFCSPVDFQCHPGCTDQPGQPTSCQVGAPFCYQMLEKHHLHKAVCRVLDVGYPV